MIPQGIKLLLSDNRVAARDLLSFLNNREVIVELLSGRDAKGMAQVRLGTQLYQARLELNNLKKGDTFTATLKRGESGEFILKVLPHTINRTINNPELFTVPIKFYQRYRRFLQKSQANLKSDPPAASPATDPTSGMLKSLFSKLVTSGTITGGNQREIEQALRYITEIAAEKSNITAEEVTEKELTRTQQEFGGEKSFQSDSADKEQGEESQSSEGGKVIGQSAYFFFLELEKLGQCGVMFHSEDRWESDIRIYISPLKKATIELFEQKIEQWRRDIKRELGNQAELELITPESSASMDVGVDFFV